MISEEGYLQLHQLFYKRFRTLPSSGRSILYEDHQIPNDLVQGNGWPIFHVWTRDFNRALKNEINGLLTNIRRLEAWSQIEEESKFDVQAKFDFYVEILGPIASSVLNTPYIVSQRFIYFATMLLHQTRMIVDPDWKDGELKEDKICSETVELFRKFFENRDKKLKSVFRKFCRNIDKINQFSRVTGNYRTLFHHRMPRRIGIGIGSMFTRIENNDGRISYGFGGVDPIEISEILPDIRKLHEICFQCFDIYWDLVRELVKIWQVAFSQDSQTAQTGI